MTRDFQTGCDDIDLKEDPWKVTRVIKTWVKLEGDKIALYGTAACNDDAFSHLALDIYRGESTGLYFYIAPSAKDARFPAAVGQDIPLIWKTPTTCPNTVLYGKMRDDRKAFSMADIHQHTSVINYDFNLVVDPGNGAPPVSTTLYEKVDPTIVEKGEGPPSGSGDR